MKTTGRLLTLAIVATCLTATSRTAEAQYILNASAASMPAPAYPAGSFCPPGAHGGGPGAGGHLAGGAYGDPNGYVTQRVADPDHWDENGPLESFLTRTFTESRFRLEYLLWHLDAPGSVRLGAQVAGLGPNQEFEVFDRVTGISLGMARVPTLAMQTLDDVNGIRFGLEFPYEDVTLELRAFALEQAGDTLDLPVFDTGPFVATTLTTNGNVQTQNSVSTIVYDRGFQSHLTSEIWGAEGNLVFRDDMPGDGLRFSPMIGFGYFMFREKLQLNGVDTNPPRGAVIESKSSNNIYGIQLGLEGEVRFSRFAIGARPKILFGLNDYKAEVRSDDLFAANEPVRTSSVEHVEFSPIFDFQVYGRVGVTENFNLFVSWQYLWTNRVSRPFNTINYDETRVGVQTRQNVRVIENLEDFFLNGLTVGGEIRFR